MQSKNTAFLMTMRVIVCPEMTDWYTSQDPEKLRIERNKSREIRKSQWWKNQLAKGVCHYCESRFRPSELTMDHRIPLARGGTSSKSNLVTCCKACNTKKQSQLEVEMAFQKLSENSDS